MTNDDGRASLLQQLVRVDYRSVRVTVGGVSFRSRAGSPPARTAVAATPRPAERSVVTPSPGWAVLRTVPGDQVAEGQVIATVRTAKGEHSVTAACDARVVSSAIVDEQFVGYGTELLRLAPDA